MSAAGHLVRCACCEDSRPAAELFQPYAGVDRCRDVAACQRRLLYSGTGAPPVTPVRPAPVPGGGPCAICGTPDPPGGVFERTPGTAICLDRPGCDARSVESQYLVAHAEEFQTVYTSSEMRAAAMGAAAQVPATVPADAAEARQAAAQADYAYSLAAAGRRR